MRLVTSSARIAFVFSTTLIAGAATAKDLPPIKTVGVVSDVGDKIRFQHIGFMAFSNSRTDIDVSDWKIDAYISNIVETTLKERYTLGAVNFPRGGIAPDLSPSLFHNPSPEKNMRANATPAHGQPLDAYVVVWPLAHEVYPTNQRVDGLGILTQGGRTRLFSAIAVSLLDGRTFETIDNCWARANPKEFFGDPDGTYMTEVKDLDVGSYDAMTPEQKQKMQQELMRMLNDGLAYCMRDLKLMN